MGGWGIHTLAHKQHTKQGLTDVVEYVALLVAVAASAILDVVDSVAFVDVAIAFAPLPEFIIFLVPAKPYTYTIYLQYIWS